MRRWQLRHYAFFLGIDPSPLGVHPYSLPPRPDAVVDSGEIGFRRVKVPLLVPSPVRGFVGSDALANIAYWVSVGRGPYPSLLVDIGTNVEIVLLLGPERATFTSVAGGPAFEDMSLSGAQAGGSGGGTAGSGEVAPPGSLVVDVLAGLLDSGEVDPSGRLRRGLSLAVEAEGRGFVLSQRFVRQFQLSKAALAAAVQTLLELAGVEVPALRRVVITGLFGNRLRHESAMRVGMLPRLPLSRFLSIADMPLMGAELLTHRPYLCAVRHAMRYVPIDGNRRFKENFNRNLGFPR